MTLQLVELLNQCGITPVARAKVLAHFIQNHGKELTARELERQCDLRQPEVSLALSAFSERKWITETKKQLPETKGRPTKLFILSVPPDVIYQSIAKGIEKESKDKFALLEKLKAAMISEKPVPVEIPPKGKQLQIGV